jgi:perosamine synthetase
MNFKITQIDPFFNLEESEMIEKVLNSSWITEGKFSSEFVERLNNLVGVPYGVLAPNGTLALTLGLLAMGVGPGDEVLVPDITFMGSATSVILCGATPICVDVDPDYFLFDISNAKKKLSRRSKAIMPVHLFGVSCNMDAILEFSKRHGLGVIEDAAQGVGVRWNDKHVGSFGDVGCFSFFADKTITTGEGGYISCRDEKIFEKLRLLRNQGRLDRGSFIHPAIGYNFRMTDIQSAMGCAQLNKLDSIIRKKYELMKMYRQGLKGASSVKILGAPTGSNQVAFRCVILGPKIKELAAHLESRKIQTRSVFYPLHRQPCLLDWENNRTLTRWLPAKIRETIQQSNSKSFPASNYFWDHGMCLPMHMKLKDTDVEFICREIRTFYS